MQLSLTVRITVRTSPVFVTPVHDFCVVTAHMCCATSSTQLKPAVIAKMKRNRSAKCFQITLLRDGIKTNAGAALNEADFRVDVHPKMSLST